MSFSAERYARAQWTSLRGDAKALAVLKEIAYWYIDDKGRCTGLSQSDLAKLTGYAKPDAIGTAIKTLVSKGLLVVQKRYAENGNVLGSDYLLPLFVREEWPEDRQGKDVFLPRSPKAGNAPDKWDTPCNGGTPCKGGRYPLERGTVPLVRGEGTPCEGGGYPLKGETRTGIGQGLDRDRTGNGQVGGAPAFAAATDEPPFPSFDDESLFEEVPPTADEIEELFPDETLPEPTKEAPKKKRSTKRGTRLDLAELPDEWRQWLEKADPTIDPDLFWEEFHDYWISVPGQKGVKLDWFATFRNAVRGMPAWKRDRFTKPESRAKNAARSFTPRSRADLINQPEEELDYDWEAFFQKRKAENDKL